VWAPLLVLLSLTMTTGLIIPLSGPATRVSGYTKNDDGQTLKNVYVVLKHVPSDDTWTTYSSNNGYYQFNVGDRTGQFYIRGYKSPYIAHPHYFYRPDSYEGVVIDVISYKDSDGDSLSDTGPPGCWTEASQGSNPNDPDTDDDGWNDYYDYTPLKRKVTMGPVVAPQWWYPEKQKWKNSYKVYIEVDIIHNHESKIVQYKNLKQICTLLDESESPYNGEMMRWTERLRVSGVYDSGPHTYTLIGTGDQEDPDHPDKSFSPKTSITFDSDNDGYGWWWLNMMYWPFWEYPDPIENDFDLTVTPNPTS
jgi:hypothetical protein